MRVYQMEVNVGVSCRKVLGLIGSGPTFSVMSLGRNSSLLLFATQEAAVAGPLAALAQHPGRLPTMGDPLAFEVFADSGIGEAPCSSQARR